MLCSQGLPRLASVARLARVAGAPTRILKVPSAVQHRFATVAAANTALDTSGQSHWKSERLVSVALLGLFPAAVVAPGLPVDMAIAVLLPAHNYMGLQVVISDYIHGKGLLAAANMLNLGMGLATVGALVYFNVSDVGITTAVKQVWAL